MPSFREVFRMLAELKQALSSRTSVVSPLTPEYSPPMIPARAMGFSASAMTRLASESSSSLPSRVTIFSPGFARRATTRRPESLFKSKACRGWPSSMSTKLVMSTTLLMERSPTASRRSTIHAGDGPTLTFLRVLPM